MADAVTVERIVTCAGCKGENVHGNWDLPQLRWHGFCVTCGLRFWHYR